ncbi:MAG: hypothetical protein JWQ89_3382 [Devosia sp.]|uniref:terminase n=1 Tax=Devosia sp. TaxID=1871048 RepID=UPI00260E6F76|nr:terminase [Devosia sp.]MDB5541655.1 hypothetical protein [Devosia sp.]
MPAPAALTSIPIDRALLDPNLLGAALGDAGSWSTWLAILKAAFGVELTLQEAAIYRSVTGGRAPPAGRVRELWSILGRRSGKSRIAAAIASYIAAFVDHSASLAAGEVGTILVLAASKIQAQSVFGYIRAFFETSPILRQLVVGETTDELRLVGNISIAVHTNNYRTIRGRTLLACIFDEVAFWRDETSSVPDVETYRAVLPALATTGGMLVGISSPYAQRGLLFTKHRDHFGVDDDSVLVVQAGTSAFNPNIDPEVLDEARRDDPESAAAEWDGLFRSDLSTFIDPTAVAKGVDPGVHERPFDRNYRYYAFCDPSGGAHDAMTMGIAHAEGERGVLDCVREVRPPFDPHDVVVEFARLLERYRISTVTGDRYAAEWVVGAFKASGIRYTTSSLSRSEVYLEALPALMAGQFILLDNPRLIAQIGNLERRTSRGGRDSVDHMRGAFDDLSNAALGALNLAASARPGARLNLPAPKVNLGYAAMKQRYGGRRQRFLG